MSIRAGIAALAALLLTLNAARAAAPVLIFNGGNLNNRVDMVILGDGYTSAQMNKFHTDAQNFADKFFDFTPFKEYKKHFNVWRIDTPSSKSGASHTGQPGTTVFGAYFKCQGVDRLLCIVPEKVEAALNAGNMTGTKRDMVIVIVNDKTYGGSGGPIAVTSTNEYSGEIAIHELGHSFGLLDDEYVDPPLCNGPYQSRGFNVTQAKTRPTIPWTRWIAANTPIPTTATKPDGTPGLYQGAFFCPTGWYRPTPVSMMNSLSFPFYQVNGEQLIRRIYAFSSPLDAVLPGAKTITIPQAGSRKFTAKPVIPGPDIKYTWRLNGVIKATTQSFTLAGNSFGGSATLELTLKDATAMVRKDPGAVTIETHNWTINRGP